MDSRYLFITIIHVCCFYALCHVKWNHFHLNSIFISNNLYSPYTNVVSERKKRSTEEINK